VAFTKKILRFTFDLAGDKTFGNSGSNRLTVSGLRATVDVTQQGSFASGNANITIYGMTLSQMNRLSTLGQEITWVRRNVVTVEAGDESTVYQGIIVEAYADASSMPEVSFRIEANVGLGYAVQPIPPTTVKGPGDVATILSGLARQCKPPLHFSNQGVTSKVLYDPYFPGTVLDQIHQVADHAGINHTIDGATQTLVIWP
jgi:hypothetical protein